MLNWRIQYFSTVVWKPSYDLLLAFDKGSPSYFKLCVLKVDYYNCAWKPTRYIRGDCENVWLRSYAWIIKLHYPYWREFARWTSAKMQGFSASLQKGKRYLFFCRCGHDFIRRRSVWTTCLLRRGCWKLSKTTLC